MPATRIKLCGFTRVDDVCTAIDAGADAIGLVFFASSKRNVSIEQAKALAAVVPPFVPLVGLFVDADPEFVETVLSQVPLSLLQFHGKESAGYCESFHRPYIKAVRFRAEKSESGEQSNSQALQKAMREHRQASGFLIDTYHPELAGGSGETFNWSELGSTTDKPIILAGGLTTKNVGAAITQVRPYAVDVSSGIEKSPGIKSASLIREFIQAVAR